jgi:hypothetical protein
MVAQADLVARAGVCHHERVMQRTFGDRFFDGGQRPA